MTAVLLCPVPPTILLASLGCWLWNGEGQKKVRLTSDGEAGNETS